MKTITTSAGVVCCFLFCISGSLGCLDSSSEEGFAMGHRSCRIIGEKFTYSRPDESSTSCICEAPPPTTTAPTTTTTGGIWRHPSHRPLSTQRPRNMWACTSTLTSATTMITTTVTPTTTTEGTTAAPTTTTPAT